MSPRAALGGRDGGGQHHLFLRVLDTPVRDERTFEIVLREPYELLIEVVAKTSTNVCYIMRRKEAETDQNQQVTTSIGSGPFLFNQDETRHGATYVYDRNPAYRPARGGSLRDGRRQGRAPRPRRLGQHG